MTGRTKWILAALHAGVAATFLALLIPALAVAQQPKTETHARVLVYTRNYTPDGKGYVHDNIAASVEAIRKMGAESGFGVDASDDPAVFTDANLKRYAALVFANSNNEAFANDGERDAFKHYIEAGGGFVGLHSASGSERNWPYYWSVLGGKFVEHPVEQKFTVKVVDAAFPATKGVPAEFEWTDECYFTDHLNPGIHVVLETDRTKLSGTAAMKHDLSGFPQMLPLAWYQEFDGGREYYLALGHNIPDYGNPILYGLLRNGILWTMKAAH